MKISIEWEKIEAFFKKMLSFLWDRDRKIIKLPTLTMVVVVIIGLFAVFAFRRLWNMYEDERLLLSFGFLSIVVLIGWMIQKNRSRQAKMVIIKIIMPLLTIFLAGVSLNGLFHPEHIKKRVVLGITNYTSSTGGKLSQRDSTFVVSASKILGPLASTYQFDMKMMGVDYEDLLIALHKGTVDLASISPYTYIYYYNKNHYCAKDKDKDPFSDFRTVGQQYNQGRAYYYSGFLKFRFDNSFDSLVEITRDTTKVKYLILNREHKSTSTYIIPTIYLEQHGREDLVNNHTEMTRLEFIQKLKRDSDWWPPGTIIAFSNDDYDNLDSAISKRLDYIRIDSVPIPYDPVMINAERWDKEIKPHEKEIKDSFGDIISFYDEPNETSWVNKNSYFIDYVESGIIVDSVLVDSAGTSVIKKESDSVYLVKFCSAAQFILPPSIALKSETVDLCREDDQRESKKPNYNLIYPMSLTPVGTGRLFRDSKSSSIQMKDSSIFYSLKDTVFTDHNHPNIKKLHVHVHKSEPSWFVKIICRIAGIFK
ncbi:MAG: hypothetical protein ACHQQQ_04805 [Bacteroidota bacterium]